MSEEPYEGVNVPNLFEEFTLYLVPLVNPDGVDLVNGLLDSGRFYRSAIRIAATYPKIAFPDGWKANIRGVDLNLQFPAGWEEAKRIKYAAGYTKPAPRDYVGPMPLSEPESVAMYQFTRMHDFALILAYHTQGEVIYWRYLDYEPEKAYAIAQYFASVSGYTPEETPGESAYAGYKDWFIQQYEPLPNESVKAANILVVSVDTTNERKVSLPYSNPRSNTWLLGDVIMEPVNCTESATWTATPVCTVGTKGCSPLRSCPHALLISNFSSHIHRLPL